MLAGETLPSPVIRGRTDLQYLILFLGDDLRECALAVGGIEAFLISAQRALENPDLAPAELRPIVDDRRVLERFELLADALGSLRRSMAAIHDSLESNTQ
jgi:hypothetical protein